MKALEAHRLVGREADGITAGREPQLGLIRGRIRKNAVRRSLVDFAPDDLFDLSPRRAVMTTTALSQRASHHSTASAIAKVFDEACQPLTATRWCWAIARKIDSCVGQVW
jgi:hypothetical protein